MKHFKLLKIILLSSIFLILLILIFDRVNINSINQEILYDTIPDKTIKIKDQFKYDPKLVYFEFDNGFHNDVIEIKSNNKSKAFGIISSDGLVGFAGEYTISRTDHEQDIFIKVNGIIKARFLLNKNYSIIHVNKESGKLTLTYSVNIWVYD